MIISHGPYSDTDDDICALERGLEFGLAMVMQTWDVNVDPDAMLAVRWFRVSKGIPTGYWRSLRRKKTNSMWLGHVERCDVVVCNVQLNSKNRRLSPSTMMVSIFIFRKHMCFLNTHTYSHNRTIRIMMTTHAAFLSAAFLVFKL